MQFQVPQFIEIEDKLVGPLTFKQFIYLLGGGGFSFLVWKLVSPYSTAIALVFVTPIIGLATALAFYKVNSRPFVVILEYAVKYFMREKLYVWSKPQQAPITSAPKVPVQPKKPAVAVPRLTESKLKDIAWSLDINEQK